jgi:hypothetical protein
MDVSCSGARLAASSGPEAGAARRVGKRFSAIRAFTCPVSIHAVAGSSGVTVWVPLLTASLRQIASFCAETRSGTPDAL